MLVAPTFQAHVQALLPMLTCPLIWLCVTCESIALPVHMSNFHSKCSGTHHMTALSVMALYEALSPRLQGLPSIPASTSCYIFHHDCMS